MKDVAIRIFTILAVIISTALLTNAQQTSACAGNCEWEVMMHNLLDEPEAILKYDVQDKVSRADLHHLSYMVNIINQIPPGTYTNVIVAERYAEFLRLIIMEYVCKADFMKEISMGRQLDASLDYSTGTYADIISRLRLVATIQRQCAQTEYMMPLSFKKVNYGNLHFLERVLYGNDVVMAGKDPYYSEVLKRLCKTLDISFDIDTSEDNILNYLLSVSSAGNVEAFSKIWKDIVRLRLCVNTIWQMDLNTILMSYALSELSMDEYLQEFNTSIREYHSDEYSKLIIPFYSMRMRSYEECMNTMNYVNGLLNEGKPYAQYLPWACPEESKTEGFEEYCEAFMKLCKIVIRTLGYELNETLIAQANDGLASILNFFGVSNLGELLYTIGNFALDMFFEGYNDAYTIIEDLLRFAKMGYYDPYQMARVAMVYTDISYSKVEEIIDVLLIPNIEYRIELWNQGTDTGARIDAMLLASLAGLTVNKDKYKAMAARYVLEIEQFIAKLPEEEKIYYYVALADVYSNLGLGYRTRDIIKNNLAELYKHNKESMDATMFMSYYYQGRYDDAMKYVKPALKASGVTYALASMETAFRTEHYGLAAKLADTYLYNRYLMVENLLMATAENKSDLNSLIRQNDISSLKHILDTSYGKKSCSDLLARTVYDWTLISKGGLLKSMKSWHSYMMENDDKLFGAYDLYNAFSKGQDTGDVPMSGEYASIVSYELADQIRMNYSWGEVVPRVTADDVIKNLPVGSYAVEFCNIADDYYAVLAGKGYRAPELYRICSKDDITSISADLFTEYLYEDAKSLRKLYDLVWEPVLKQVPEGSDIYCSLDGILNLLNVELFRDASMRYVGDVYDIHRVSTTASIKEPAKMADFSKAVLYGDLNYYMNHTEISSDSDKYIYDAASAKYRGAVMDYVVPRELLEETREEVRTVAELMKKNQVDTLLFEWNNGTEFSFKSLSGKDFDVLHMATHGFWWGSEMDLNGEKVHPMRRSGLVLSGSDEEPLSSDKAGVLFAQEIADLDLSSVDLLVLSACQTAGGEIMEDGVFGLQRGFKQAGVGTIVMTLWPVKSGMTQTLMTLMYENLGKGYNTREAFYNARTEVRKQYKKASDWGAFIILD